VTDKARRYWERNLDLLIQVTETEDFVMCEQIQRSFRSGAQQSIQFGRNEPGLAHYHAALDELLQLETPVALKGSTGSSTSGPADGSTVPEAVGVGGA
jgi:hypothetical protein